MIVRGATPAHMCREIEPILARWTDLVIPNAIELAPGNRYSPAYAWMFSYERRLKQRIERALRRPLRPFDRLVFGVDGVLSEAISNAFVHGHRRDGGLPIDVESLVGLRGLVFSVRDQGPGFPVNDVLARMSSGSAYFAVAGNGLRVFAAREQVIASYTEGGRQIHLQVLFAAGAGNGAYCNHSAPVGGEDDSSS